MNSSGLFENNVALYRCDKNDFKKYRQKLDATITYFDDKDSADCNAFATEEAGNSMYKKDREEEFFNSTLYGLELNIVDKDGNQLVKTEKILLHKETKYSIPKCYIRGNYDNYVTFSNIPENIMKMIDNGEAYLNLAGVKLAYGKYSASDDEPTQPSAFIKNFEKLSLNTDFINTSNIYKKGVEQEDKKEYLPDTLLIEEEYK